MLENNRTHLRRTIKYYLIGLTIFISSSLVLGQNKKMDSLNSLLNAAKDDTTRLSLYCKLGEACDIKDNLKYAQPALKLVEKLFTQTKDSTTRKNILLQKATVYGFFHAFYQYNGDSVLKYYEKKLIIYKEIKDIKKQVDQMIAIGFVYNTSANIPKAFEYFQQALKLSKENKYDWGIANSLLYLGNLYEAQGDSTQGIKNFQEYLRITSFLRDTSAMAEGLIQMANVYDVRHNVKIAQNYYCKALSLYEGIKSFEGIRNVYNLIGIMYWSNNNLDSALIYFDKSLILTKQKVPNLSWSRGLLGNIAGVYLKKGDITKALEYNFKSLQVAQELVKQESDSTQIAFVYNRFAEIYFKQRNYTKAKNYNTKLLKLLKETASYQGDICRAELFASQIDSASGNFKEAYGHYKNYIVLQKKLNSEEVKKAATKQKYQSEYDKQKAEAKVEQDKKDIIVSEEKRKQKLITWSVVGGLFLVLVFAGFIFRSLRVTRKQKTIIEEKNKEVEEKNKDILDSIHYAKRIQTSLLPTEKYIERILNK